MPLHLHEESQDLCTLGPGLLGLTTAAPFGCDKRYQKCPSNTATTSVTQAVRRELVPRTKVNTSKASSLRAMTVDSQRGLSLPKTRNQTKAAKRVPTSERKMQRHSDTDW